MRQIETLAQSEYDTKIGKVYTQKKEICIWQDRNLFSISETDMVRFSLRKKRRFSERAEFIITTSKQMANTGQRQVSRYFPNAQKNPQHTTSKHSTHEKYKRKLKQKKSIIYFKGSQQKATYWELPRTLTNFFYTTPAQGSDHHTNPPPHLSTRATERKDDKSVTRLSKIVL